jgi:hypothetical protein
MLMTIFLILAILFLTILLFRVLLMLAAGAFVVGLLVIGLSMTQSPGRSDPKPTAPKEWTIWVTAASGDDIKRLEYLPDEPLPRFSTSEQCEQYAARVARETPPKGHTVTRAFCLHD